MVTIRFDLGHDLDLEFSRTNMEFAISRPKIIWLPRNKTQTYLLNSRPQIWPSDLTLAMTLILNFQGQIWNVLYLNQKWFDCHETKSKHIDWTPGHKCDQYVWPWHDLDLWIFKVKCDLNHWPHTWLWPWIFMVKFWNSCISEWEGRLTLNKGDGSKSFITMNHLTKVRCNDLPDSDQGDFRCRRTVDSSSLFKYTKFPPFGNVFSISVNKGHVFPERMWPREDRCDRGMWPIAVVKELFCNQEYCWFWHQC